MSDYGDMAAEEMLESGVPSPTVHMIVDMYGQIIPAYAQAGMESGTLGVTVAQAWRDLTLIGIRTFVMTFAQGKLHNAPPPGREISTACLILSKHLALGTYSVQEARKLDDEWRALTDGD